MERNKYQDALIYTIKTDNGLYVGSTCDFVNRKVKHKSNSKELNQKLYQNIRENGGEYSMEIYKMFPCNSEKELQMEEEKIRKYLNANLNMKSCYGRDIEKCKQTAKNYQENNREYFCEASKKHRNKYAEKIKEQKSEVSKKKLTCECGVVISYGSRYRHITSQKHLNLMELKSSQDPSSVLTDYSCT